MTAPEPRKLYSQSLAFSETRLSQIEASIARQAAWNISSPSKTSPAAGRQADFPIRTGQPPAARPSAFTIPSHNSGSSALWSSKRDIEIIDIDSSEDESSDNDGPFRRKRQRLTPIVRDLAIPPASAPPEPATRPTRGKLVATFRHVQIPSKRPGIAPAIIPKSPEAKARRERFLQNLTILSGPPIRVFNNIDETSPSITFQFINTSILGPRVEAISEEVMVGCSCRKDNGRQIGCEYLSCECLEDSQENSDGKKVFPYAAGKFDFGCLRPFYLNSRNHIFECNKNCNCDLDCKNRLVQHGRKVALEIFKTQNRGWGLRCPEPLRRGSFIDTYRGEILTSEDTEERSKSRNVDEDNYLLALDKFTEPQAITKSDFLRFHPDEVHWHNEKVRSGDWKIYRRDGQEMWLNPDFEPHKYDCDGMYAGSPTRFMNHSCEPNCRLFTVSYNHSDTHIYELAFFTIEAVPAHTELTFDYKDEDDRSLISDETALEIKHRDGYMPQKCLCGTESCRRYFFN